MPSHAAIADKHLTIPPDMEVEDALKELKKKKMAEAVVVDESGVAVGLFSLRIVMQNLLPVSVAMSDGIQLDVKVRAAPGIAKRLKKVHPLPVETLMDRKFAYIYPETPIWEAVHHLVHTSPSLIVVEAENKKFVGMITAESAMAELKRLLDSEE